MVKNIIYTTKETPENSLRSIENMSAGRISPNLRKQWFNECPLRKEGDMEAGICEPYNTCVNKGQFIQLWCELAMSN